MQKKNGLTHSTCYREVLKHSFYSFFFYYQQSCLEKNWNWTKIEWTVLLTVAKLDILLDWSCPVRSQNSSKPDYEDIQRGAKQGNKMASFSFNNIHYINRIFFDRKSNTLVWIYGTILPQDKIQYKKIITINCLFHMF